MNKTRGLIIDHNIIAQIKMLRLCFHTLLDRMINLKGNLFLPSHKTQIRCRQSYRAFYFVIMSLSKERQEQLKHLSKRDHLGNLDKICVRCLNKSKGNVMNCDHELLVIQYLWEHYERDKEYLPHGLCPTCRLVLQSQSKFDKSYIDR